jgi:hypothetical protein
MIRFFCPSCWSDFTEDLARCPNCGLDIRTFWTSRDYVDKLIVALGHPEPETPIRAAELLGRIGDGRAIEPLKQILASTKDVYLAREAAHALGRFLDAEVRLFLGAMANHPAEMVRREIEAILSRQVICSTSSPSSTTFEGDDDG